MNQLKEHSLVFEQNFFQFRVYMIRFRKKKIFVNSELFCNPNYFFGARWLKFIRFRFA